MERRHRPKILLADDHTLIAQGCKSFMEHEFEVVGIVANGRALLSAARELNPDVVVLDIEMPELNGLDACEQLKRSMRTLKLVFLTVHTQPEICAEAFRRGASGYVLKHSAASELVIAVKEVLRGGSYITPLITKETVRSLLRTGNDRAEQKRITCRESEVLQLLVEGKSMKEVASVLDVRPGTVAFHKYKIMEKFGLRSNADLLRFAMERRMFS
jgi:DNA-binding NarL/FixJ family response regulator